MYTETHPASFIVPVDKLDPKRGAYYYIKVDQELVDALSKKRSTRLICKIDSKLKFQCGLNHLGDGNFFIIISTARMKYLQVLIGDVVEVELWEDPNTLGVEIPEVLEVLMAQDENIKTAFEKLTDGKKRSLIFSIIKIKNIDLQVSKILKFFELRDSKREL